MTALLDEIETIEVHDFVPRRYKVADELFLRVGARVDLRNRTELGVRAEDEVDGRPGPLDRASRTVAPLVHVLRAVRPPPLGAHVEQVHEEVVGQRLGPVGEYAVPRLANV